MSAGRGAGGALGRKIRNVCVEKRGAGGEGGGGGGGGGGGREGGGGGAPERIFK